jgi:hypothetical protein
VKPDSILYWLLAIVVLVMVGMAAAAGVGCLWLTLNGRAEVGACLATGLVQQIRETWAEAVAVILALLLAARSGNGPKPPA